MADEARRAWEDDDLAEFLERRKREKYLASLCCVILLPLLGFAFLVGPFLFTYWHQHVRIMWWLGAALLAPFSLYVIISHDREFGYTPKIVSASPAPYGADNC
ncbi:hypothetical protein ACP70R_024078 [Stipagrostis hirtigluma subsp. patula]